MTHKEASRRYRHWQPVILGQLDLIAELVKEHEPDQPHYGHVGDLAQASTSLDAVIGQFEGVDNYDSMDHYDTVRVHFEDGTTIVVHVLEDDEIQDKIVDLCEAECIDMLTVINFTIEE